MSSYLRKRVSQNRNRLIEGKYDLDLTYITNNLIAMGYPSDKTFQKFIRNQIEKVSKFLNEKHQNSFKIFNLCDETDYDISHFNHMVEIFPVVDHCPPKFFQIEQFCKKLDNWLKNSANNVGIVHCKAGKGRTGTMISCYLVYSKLFDNPFDAINEFNCRRCNDARGITIPSQLRYIEYYADFVTKSRVYQECELFLKSIKINASSQTNDEIFKSKGFNTSNPIFLINCFKIIRLRDQTQLFLSEVLNINSNRSFLFEISKPVRLVDDILVCFVSKSSKTVMKVYFNTFCLMQDNEFSKNESISYLGKRSFKQKVEIEPNSGKEDVNNQTILWELKKRQIDIASKNDDINPDFTMIFEFELGKTSESDYMKTKDYVNEFIEENRERVVFRLESGFEDAAASSEKLEKSMNKSAHLSKNASFFRDLFGKRPKEPRRSTSEPSFHIHSLSKTPSEGKMQMMTPNRNTMASLAHTKSSRNSETDSGNRSQLNDYWSDTSASSLRKNYLTNSGAKAQASSKNKYKTRIKKLFS